MTEHRFKPNNDNNKIKILLSFIIPIFILVLIIIILINPFQKKEEAPKYNNLYNAEIMVFSKAQNIDYNEYPNSLIELFYRNRETRDFVLDYPLLKNEKINISLDEYSTDEVPLFMQWDKRWGYKIYGDNVAGITACGPVCLSMCAYYLTEDEVYSPNKMIDYAKNNGYCVTGNGTSWELFSKGAVELGFDVTEIGLDKERILNNLEIGNPIVAIMGPGDFTTSGHYIVFAGTENELIKINDPNSTFNSEKLWEFDDIKDQIRNLWVIRYFPDDQ